MAHLLPESRKSDRTELSVETKLKIIHNLEKKAMDRKEVQEKFRITNSTISKLLKNRNELRKIALENGNLGAKRQKSSRYDKLNETLFKWLVLQFHVTFGHYFD